MLTQKTFSRPFTHISNKNAFNTTVKNVVGPLRHCIFQFMLYSFSNRDFLTIWNLSRCIPEYLTYNLLFSVSPKLMFYVLQKKPVLRIWHSVLNPHTLIMCSVWCNFYLCNTWYFYLLVLQFHENGKEKKGKLVYYVCYCVSEVRLLSPGDEKSFY